MQAQGASGPALQPASRAGVASAQQAIQKEDEIEKRNHEAKQVSINKKQPLTRGLQGKVYFLVKSDIHHQHL